jgi:hypothetical protein
VTVHVAPQRILLHVGVHQITVLDVRLGPEEALRVRPQECGRVRSNDEGIVAMLVGHFFLELGKKSWDLNKFVPN